MYAESITTFYEVDHYNVIYEIQGREHCDIEFTEPDAIGLARHLLENNPEICSSKQIRIEKVSELVGWCE